jgi:hypothetical protein
MPDLQSCSVAAVGQPAIAFGSADLKAMTAIVHQRRLAVGNLR